MFASGESREAVEDAIKAREAKNQALRDDKQRSSELSTKMVVRTSKKNEGAWGPAPMAMSLPGAKMAPPPEMSGSVSAPQQAAPVVMEAFDPNSPEGAAEASKRRQRGGTTAPRQLSKNEMDAMREASRKRSGG